nr:hypothetical protein [Flavobacterium sp. ASV13]
MNPFNLLINYFIANSRANYYNIPGNTEVTNTGILTGMISENPLLNYLIIDNKAKIEGNNSHAVTPEAVVLPVVHSTPSLPPAGAGSVPIPPKEQPVNVITLEAVRNEIAAGNKNLEETILKELSGLKAKIESFDKDKIAINESIAKIEKRLDEVAKTNQTGNTKPVEPDVKTQSKTNPK